MFAVNFLADLSHGITVHTKCKARVRHKNEQIANLKKLCGVQFVDANHFLICMHSHSPVSYTS